MRPRKSYQLNTFGCAAFLVSINNRTAYLIA
jgi:hypothetical protein